MCPLRRLPKDRARAPAKPLPTPPIHAVLHSSPVLALPGGEGLGCPCCCPVPADTLPHASARAAGAEPCRLGECSCGAKGAKRAVPAREINSGFYVLLSGRLGSDPMGLGLSCSRWLVPALAPAPGTPVWPQPEPVLATSRGTVGKESPPSGALETGGAGSWGAQGSGGYSRRWVAVIPHPGWQQHPACSLAAAVAEGSVRGRARARCLSQNRVPCQKPFVCDVWLPKPVLPGLEVGGEWGGC